MILQVEEREAGLRLDQFLARRRPEVSRERWRRWIESGRVRVASVPAKPALRLKSGQRIELDPEPRPPELARAFPEDLPLEILYEDDDLVAVNKPAGMVVHAGAGRSQGTLVNALLHRFQRLSTLGGERRPGIVHRLDRLTSGVLLVAKSDTAHASLAGQLARRQVRKIYLALVHGRIEPARHGRPIVEDGLAWTRLEMPIGRDRRRRGRMSARVREGRPSVTDFRVLEEWPGFSLLELRIVTGRTHQIRAHLSAVGHLVAGDRLYGAPLQPALAGLFLHARRVSFIHPSSGRLVTIESPLPKDLQHLLTRRGAGLTLL